MKKRRPKPAQRRKPLHAPKPQKQVRDDLKDMVLSPVLIAAIERGGAREVDAMLSLSIPDPKEREEAVRVAMAVDALRRQQHGLPPPPGWPLPGKPGA